MEETNTAHPVQAPAMDVVAPPVPAAESKAEPEAVKAAPPDEDKKTKPVQAQMPKDIAKSKPQKPPKQPSNGVGTAIIATVIIVIGLAAMATYAYIKTQN